jgi:hypothetical protein
MSESGRDNAGKVPAKIGNQELFRASDPMQEQFADEDAGLQRGPRPAKLVLIFLVLVMAGFGVFAFMTLGRRPGQPKMSAQTDDLGAGISQASGLRGHLVVRWQDKTQYMLKIEPLDPRNAQEFAAVTANPSKPISIDVRVLDSAGFALCGKEIVLHVDPSRTGHAPTAGPQKQSGIDVFRTIQGADGSVEALWAEGDLPCSPDQYRRFDYWDLSTNFPTLAEQDQVLGHKPAVTARNDHAPESPRDAEPQTSRETRAEAARRRAVKKAQPAYLIQGDDRATAFDSSRGVLVVGVSTRFLIDRKSDEQMVAGWAEDDSLIHFTCDSRANCSLRRAGTAALVPARMNE